MESSDDNLITSAFSRFVKVSNLVGNIGLSLLGNKTLNLFSNEAKTIQRNAEFWLKNGDKILKTLGNLKGGAMKIGQMLSLQEGLLPPELLQVIRLLQKEAPSLPFSTMETVLLEEIPNYKELFKSISKEPFAAASIGQVYKGVLKDGRKVVIKIQYPGIEEIIKSDLKNLKILFKILISSFLKINIDKIWEEVNSQLINELDYEKELNNQNRFYEYYKDSEIAIIPKAIKELSTKRVLTSEMLLGDDIYICKKQSLAKRSLWSKNLFTLFLEQTFKFNFLHSDPNVGNFAFLENGKIIIYDFGSVKELPKEFAESLKKIFFLIQKHEFSSLPQAIKDLGIYHSGGKVLEDEILTNYAKLVYPVFAEEEYSFEGERFVVKEMMELKMNYTWKLMDIQVPSDLIFINRTLIGLTGNLNILQAKVNIKELLKPYEN